MTSETFDAVWHRAVRDHGDRQFLVFGDGETAPETWTYGEFDDIVARVSARLLEAGVMPGSSIHLALKNCPAFIALWLAAAKIGAWIVPVDPSSAAREIASQIERTSPRIGIYAAARGDVYRDGARGRLESLIELSETADDVGPSAPLLSSAGPTDDGRHVSPAETDRLAVMFTSGTTSAPKGVELTQANYANVARAMSAVIGLRPEHRWLVTLPLFHANAQYYCFASAIAVGAGVALTPTFSASRWCRQADALEATHASLFAAPIRMILARRPSDAPELHLEHVWFAQNLSSAQFREFAGIIGTEPRQLYGMTETVAIVTADLSTTPSSTVIGTPILDRTVAVVDPATYDPVDPGEVGLLLVEGVPGQDLFAGYLDAPEITARAFHTDSDGRTWFATGDLVTVRRDGAYRFVGRIDDVIKVSGENVSLTEVEAAIADAPGVLEVAVVARPDDVRDQVPVAYVVARHPDDPPRIADLAAWAERNLASAARPVEWQLIDELPRTSVGKIRRFKLTSGEGRRNK
ncbi:class I adenylate-forming enzyme family protein [Spelaeicoccus albus]|uniref:Crotonobetaine/carnitine-CoA ligase n=1 Tax=Spelaeicoccus albus TaxID=1280376 RepID=A0A7Z0D007_9MICO|nr:class I adenylate-forming enzyme family protein [Spelaeicoccus albus]NYI66789.1 crotonobetaine/carnitine-CoA ligase [Spelaeicoccus albus]